MAGIVLVVIVLAVEDIVGKGGKAGELGMRLERIDMPNADPQFVAILARLTSRALAHEPATA